MSIDYAAKNQANSPTTATEQSIKSNDAAMRDDVKLILDQVREAVSEIECSVGQIGDCLIELCCMENIPEGVEELADDFRDADLTDIGDHFERFCKGVAAVIATSDENETA